ncbi:nitronate monooxygenase [Conexibacter sp. SYSU D00693]|uniref:nitronate monooxygenase n=1 Tax=Conexibacter sp. SYSU D00693 TaxID=2812560 RepID=UPI00196AE798|nr:nitronate monooxygenase [Conexibacter sp. SYSU D00693]
MTARFDPARLVEPVVQAPLAGGPSTVALATAVSGAGGLGFLAAGYKAVDAVAGEVAAARGALGDAPFGVNLFVPSPPTDDADAVRAYARRLEPEAAAAGVALGEPRHDDDGYAAKLDVVVRERVPVVSTTFGCPSPEDVARLQDAGAAVWVTVTSTAEARAAHDAGADAVVVQGAEAGGHQGGWLTPGAPPLGLLALLQLVAPVGLPMVAAGSIATGAGVAAVLAAGATAAQLGTAFLRAPEAGTAPVHREALRGDAPTALTRAFTGRTARGIVNRFLREHDGSAPAAYPEVHHLTAPLRAAARERGDADLLHLWAGQAYQLATDERAADLVRRLGQDARSTGQGVKPGGGA